MSSYFPIPRNFSFNFKNKEFLVKSSIDVFNFPNNITSKSLIESNKKDIFFSLYKIKDFKWIKVYDYPCLYGECLSIKRENLDIDPESTALLIPSLDKNNPFKTDTLPKPITLRIDKSPVNERASYNFTLNYSFLTFSKVRLRCIHFF